MSNELLRSFRFQVKLLKPGAADTTATRLVADCGFQECSGLEIEMDVQELPEGGRNDGVIRRIGRGKYTPIVLKRGMLFPAPDPPAPDRLGWRPPVDLTQGGAVDAALWNWLQELLSGRTMVRYDGIVEVMSVGDHVVARWVFDRGLPQKVVGPQLNARTGEVAIEELHIAHEGLRLAPL